jgi:hypothetical protein
VREGQKKDMPKVLQSLDIERHKLRMLKLESLKIRELKYQGEKTRDKMRNFFFCPYFD